MKIYNTLTRQKEDFVPQKPGTARIYACGPTVYDYIHIGNARPLVVFDVLRRFLAYRGYDVRFVQNFTDIDDKIIRRANEHGVDSAAIAEEYIGEYWKDAKGLALQEATVHPRATENIEQIIEIVSGLIAKGIAYEAQGDVYYSPAKFAEYGKLSHQPLDELVAGARIMTGEIKREPMDFALWKAAKPGEPYWESPWGNGRPGWHIECSAMVLRYLGETADIHCGGQDLIFPHHENEIAQSEAYTGKPFSRYWMHNGYININNAKMSKSKGNFFTVRQVAEKYGYAPIRFFLISSHYRSPINYTPELLDSSIASLQRLQNCRDNLIFAKKNAALPEKDGDLQTLLHLETHRESFIAALDDDLNTADALGALFELVREINTRVLDAEPSKRLCKAALKLFAELCGVLGILQPAEAAAESAADDETAKIEALITARGEARTAKSWAEADRIRDELNAMGVVIEDTPLGVKWTVKR
ncbi:MAG: cysteine--tRNA ligase [Oscillospiraceae bacterium]|jgi:cysteinyl-tRNA synthetase|nr:cysteine--tRNA ligase [Oscillospiraceae bacterium]